MPKVTTTISLDIDVFIKIDEIMQWPQCPFKSRSDVIRTCVSMALPEIISNYGEVGQTDPYEYALQEKQAMADQLGRPHVGPIHQRDSTTAPREIHNSDIPLEGVAYFPDRPLSERTYNNDHRVPPKDDDGTPNPEHFKNKEDLEEFINMPLDAYMELLELKKEEDKEREQLKKLGPPSL